MRDKMTAATEKFEEPTVVEIRKALDAKIPRNVIAKRDSGAGKKLDYLEGWYVIARLNEVLGQGNWEYGIKTLQLVHSGETNGKQTVHYLATVELKAMVGGHHAYFSDVGYGDGSDKYNIGKAHELAAKEAVTDAVKRCAKNLGMSLGLALYDKSQENVDDGEDEETKVQASAPRAAGVAAMGPVRGGSSETVSAPAAQDAGPSRETLNRLISEAGNVAVKQRKTTVGDLKQLMSDNYNASKKEDLTDAQAQDFLNKLKGIIGG
jgi:DNA recombination protein Rad52